MITFDKERDKIFLEVESSFLEQSLKIESWFVDKWGKNKAPFYSSVDVRNSGFKVTPVDTNLFPGGFNNLDLNKDINTKALKMALDKIGDIKTVALIPEEHTRNTFYLQNVYSLMFLIEKAGFNVVLGRVSCTNKEVLKTNDGKELSFYPVEKKGDEIFINNIKPCVILLNNDLSTGIPEILQNIKQPIAPETKFGWHNRTKHNHFIQYDKVVDEFCNKFGIEPYLLRTHHDTVDNVDFSDVDSLTELSVKAESLFDRINDSYKKFNIKEEPFVVVKSNTGTYGMGVITIKNHLDILKLNKNQRKKMKSNKGGLKLNSVLLQEGVPTIERWGSESNTAETVIYLIDGFTVGGFYRTHSKKTHTDSLNSPGMVFAPMSFSIPCCNKCVVDLSMEQNVLYAYGIVARLAAMASTYE